MTPIDITAVLDENNTPIVDWDWLSIEDLFDMESEDDFNLGAICEGIRMAGGTVETLAVLHNIVSARGFIMKGSTEELLLLPDGRIVMTESEEGFHNVTAGPVEDVDAFVEKIRVSIEGE